MLWRVLRRVYAHPSYWALSAAVSGLTLSLMVLLPNMAVLSAVLFSPAVSALSKVAFVGALYGSLVTNFTIVSAVSVVLISGLFGINAALLGYFIKRARGVGKVRATRTTTLSGMVAAVLGVGCAACGSAVLVVVLKLIGIAWIISYLPLHGAEFGLIGVGLLLLTTRSLARKISDPLVCPL